MSNTIDWAKNEVALAKKAHANDLYGNVCFDDALRALKAIGIEKHSGGSWAYTTNILYRLMRGLPLTPVTEEDFKDVKPYTEMGGHAVRQCPRQSSLFRYDWPDGRVRYHDQDRTACVDLDTGDTIGCWLSEIVDELYPITLPYMPGEAVYELYFRTEHWHLKEASDGRYDIWVYMARYLLTPDRRRVVINRRWIANPGSTERLELTDEEYEKIQKNGKLMKSRRSKQ